MSEILAFLRGMIPTQLQIEWGAVVSAVGTAFSYICGWDGTIEAKTPSKCGRLQPPMI